MSSTLTADKVASTQARIQQLARQQNAVILAHNYQLPEVQDVAHVVGDSLQLARTAAETDADVIVFCGVHFMAETAAVLCPDKTVLIPDPQAGCSLADSITADQLRSWKAQYPDAVVVSYVNTTAAVKAETDICCTSTNAVNVVQSIPEDKDILFGPDMFLGSYVKAVTGRKNMRLWLGECHVHAGIRPEEVHQARQAHPEADFLIHPECGCVTNTLDMLAHGTISADNTHVLSTGQMLRHAARATHHTMLVATEVGILHGLSKANPDKTFIPVRSEATCEYMKMITLDKVEYALRHRSHQVTVPAPIADKARLSITRMLAIDG